MTCFKSIALAAGLAVAAGPTALVLFDVPAAQAQTSQRAQMPRITGLDVKEVERIEPGAELEFTLWGTPGAAATLQIDGARNVALLAETTPGVYQGIYTITNRDRVAPNAKVTGNLRQGNRVGTALLDEPLQRGWQSQPVAVAGPQIARFTVTHGRADEAGSVLHFTLIGTPGGRATARLPAAEPRRVTLDEVRPGEYSATYTVQPYDRIDVNQPVTARLRVGDNVVSTSLERALDAGRLAQRRIDARQCPDCGTVLAVNRIEVEGEGGVVGGVTGGVLGAVLGSQFGKGDGRTAAGVAGAVGGALLGRQVERNSKKKEHYEVVVRLNGGTQQTVSYDSLPPVKVGDVVRIVDGALQPQFS